ncbi:MAG TPA: exonuclease domain-containing protein [Parapedobacter sp.]|uniref:exonuclease domain-containing protein n=1 Tax=Parapedobacter sp. TaxID=1958893 RepID=UPI002C8E4518|nr:exonuclease domain-containing protein [Parapedobacter sp.]HWK58704.1 exonuclease domain-containing protein [Parapedobacter sp.]
MDFIAIDFETADETRYSPCQLGITTVRCGKVIENKKWNIKPACWPDFNPFNISVHGIEPDQVANAPTFPDLWPEIAPYFQDTTIIAHNAAFDVDVLRQTLDYHRMPMPSFDFVCSYCISKQAWPHFGAYSLPLLCNRLDIKLTTHHDAQADSLAAAQIFQKIVDQYHITGLPSVALNFKIRIGTLSETLYIASNTVRQYDNKKRDMSRFVPTLGKEDTESVFYGQNVVFTGKLSSMQRELALQTIVDIGGYVSETLTTSTNFLVVGQQDTAIVGISGMSGKQKKAISFAEKGHPIEVVSEQFFLNNI